MLYAPYIIRDEQGYWHTYKLERSTESNPVGVCLIVMIQYDEILEIQAVIDALKPALKPAPVGDWYLITVAERVIRKDANTLTPIVISLKKNDKVQITEKKKAPPGEWGKVVTININGTIRNISGWIYLGSLKKE